MPALPNVPQVLRVHLEFTIGTDATTGCRMFFKYSGGAPSIADCSTIGSGIGQAFTTTMLPHLSSDVTLNAVEVTDLTSPSSGQGTSAVGNPGGAVGTTMPAGAAILFNHHITRRYRGGKPRTYLPPSASGNLKDAQHWSDAFANSCNGSFVTFISETLLVSAGTTVLQSQVNVGYYGPPYVPYTDSSGKTKYRPTLKPSPIVPDLITGSIINRIVGSQRRRYAR